MAAAVRKVIAGQIIVLVVALCCTQANGATVPPCGTYEGIPHDASINGVCTLPDGEVLESAVWAGRNPGTPVNYNVNWTYGGDGSKPGGGFAAIHGCENDNVTFFIEGSRTHQLVLIATQAQAPCGFSNAIAATEVLQAPTVAVVNFTGRNGFFNYADSEGDNCDAGKMHIQIIFHSFPTPKYGCYAAGEGPPSLAKYPPAPPMLDEFTSGAPVSGMPLAAPLAAPSPAPLPAPAPAPGTLTAPAPTPVTAAAPSPSETSAPVPATAGATPTTGSGTSPSPAAPMAAAPEPPVNVITPVPTASSPASSTAAAPTAAAPAPAPSAADRRAAPSLWAAAASLALASAVAASLA